MKKKIFCENYFMSKISHEWGLINDVIDPPSTASI